jgi:cytoskeletal protein RodZ
MRESRSLSPFAVGLRQARLSRALSIDDVARTTLLSDKQILGLENDDYSYFYNGLFAARSADACAALLGVDPMLEGAPPRVPVEPPNLVASIDKTGAPRSHKKRSERRNGLVFWALLIFILLSAYGLS